MTSDFARRPAELVLTASVARRYYLDGKSKIEIADEFRLSRFKVARLINAARTSGLVRIEIGYPGVVNVDLSARLQEAFALRHAVVVDASDEHPAALRRQLGAAAADLLAEITTADDVLGLAWARSVGAMTAALTRLAAVVRDVATARALRRQPEVARAFAHFSAVTKAVVGVGLWAPGQSTVYDATEERERRQVRRLGACADVSGVLVGSSGEPIKADLGDRTIGVNAAQMRAIPEVIAIAYGKAKTPAVRAAIRSRLVSGLVTHATLASDLLATA